MPVDFSSRSRRHHLARNRELAPPFRFRELSRFRGDHGFTIFLPPSYIFGKTLGEGEFAEVKLAFDIRSGRHVAVKCFLARSGLYGMLEEQIRREIMALKGLNHPNIVRTYEAIFYGTRVFLVMEYCPYGDLRRFINCGGALTEVHAREFFGHLCMGLKKMHSIDLVHRDLKLENVLIDSKFKAKITDFGCARRQMGKELHTVTGSFVYGAPELVSGKKYDGKKADVWSLGIILYAMVTGKLPYRASRKVTRVLEQRMKPPLYPSYLSKECCQLLTKMLTYDPINRITLDVVMTHIWMLRGDH